MATVAVIPATLVSHVHSDGPGLARLTVGQWDEPAEHAFAGMPYSLLRKSPSLKTKLKAREQTRLVAKTLHRGGLGHPSWPSSIGTVGIVRKKAEIKMAGALPRKGL